MSAYITSSVTERRMNRSSSRPSYREKSSGSPNRTPTLRSRGRTVPGGWISYVLIIATGMIGTRASRAMRAKPVLPRYIVPFGERVPSG